MKWLNADIGAVQAALQETPEVFHRVRVDVSVYVLDSVVNHGVLVMGFQTAIGLKGTAEKSRPGFAAFPDDWLQFLLSTGGYVIGYNLPAAFYHTEGNFLIRATRAGNLFGPLVLVHVARFAADEGFINFYFTTQLVESSILHSKTNPMKHEPRGLLSNAKPAMDFIAADTVFAVDGEPCGRKPLLQRKRGVLKDGARL